MSKQDVPFFSLENMRSLGTIIIIVFAIRDTIASPYHVPTPSMEPTIKVGDRLIANKLAYDLKVPFSGFFMENPMVLASWDSPKRGDIVVFEYPRDPSLDFVKRVVGVAGDTIHLKDNLLHVNGEPVEVVEHNEERDVLNDIKDNKDSMILYQEKIDPDSDFHWMVRNKYAGRGYESREYGPQPYVVPEGTVFCMGDNRDNSSDSTIWGPVPLEKIKGRASFVLWSMYWAKDDDTLPTFRWARFFDGLQ